MRPRRAKTMPVRPGRARRRPARAGSRTPQPSERRLREAIALCERMEARAFLAVARVDLGAPLHPSIEGRRLLDQALTADELGMTSLAKRAPTAHTYRPRLDHRRPATATRPS